MGMVFCVVCVFACSGSVDPVSVSGNVTNQNGKPVTGVRLILIPSDNSPTNTFGFDLDGEGHFKGQALPGRYTYYFATIAIERDEDDGRPVNKAEAKKLKVSTQSLKTLPSAYYSAKGAGTDRVIELKSGTTLSLVVSK
jgi:hypothetical protein